MPSMFYDAPPPARQTYASPPPKPPVKKPAPPATKKAIEKAIDEIQSEVRAVRDQAGGQ
jgi:hypothetical protein